MGLKGGAEREWSSAPEGAEGNAGRGLSGRETEGTRVSGELILAGGETGLEEAGEEGDFFPSGFSFFFPSSLPMTAYRLASNSISGVPRIRIFPAGSSRYTRGVSLTR